MLLTVPTLFLWWYNKDKKWYINMPWYEKFSKWTFAEGDIVVQILRPYEWGNYYSALPEAIIDAAYRKDPKAITEAFKYIFESTNPFSGLSAAFGIQSIKPIAEQMANKLSFNDISIVSRANLERKPEKQYDEYTSRFAKKAGRILKKSPQRIDALIKGYLGGLGSDALEALDLPAAKKRPWQERIPLVNQFFRRGGIHGKSRLVAQVYNELDKASMEKKDPGDDRAFAEAEIGRYYMLKQATILFKGYNDLLKKTEDEKEMNGIRDDINKLAEDVLKESQNMHLVKLTRIYHLKDTSITDFMKEKNKLSEEDQNLIRKWIREKVKISLPKRLERANDIKLEMREFDPELPASALEAPTEEEKDSNNQ
jgi:hypothetical protein